MNGKPRPFTILIALLSSILIVCVGGYYVFSVRSSLWTKSVTEILEVTTQGRHALDTYIEKDKETLHLLATELSITDSDDASSIEKKMGLPYDEETSYVCVVFSLAKVYTNFTETGTSLGEDDLKLFQSLEGNGVREPFLDGYTGVRKLGVYERFHFADGAEGIVQKTQTLKSISKRFSLSFFDDSGFSYVVNRAGDVLVRSMYRNSNRTFQNLFDIIDLQGNDAEAVDSFQNSLANGDRGVAQFRYSGEEYVFCYVPLEDAEGWYVISIIPNAVIMKQVNDIVSRTLWLCALILVCLLAVGLSFYYQLKKHHKETEQLAYYDTLTGLFRYEKFRIEGEKILKREPSLTILYMDVVGFKLINDLEGYEYGDEVLHLIAEGLKKNAREGDISCRVAGDDFVMLTTCSDKEAIGKLCGDIFLSCKEKTGNGRPLRLRIGICRSEDAGDVSGISGLIDRARMAQRNIPDTSEKNICFYTREMRSQLLKTAEIEKEMDHALAEGEFVHYIQPKYSPDGSRVLGGEALVRWQKKDGSVVSPGEFIPLFEKNGFIKKLDEYIFRCVCKEMKLRLDAGLPVVPISVNVSRANLFRENFAAEYTRIKEENGIPDHLLELELTESLMLENTEDIFSILGDLRKKGFCCSIDDFGSGYSSLNALKDLPADVLKLDRKFLEESEDVGKNETIIRFVIEMAKKLSMVTVAEGVETQEQLTFLRETGCDMIQGFIFSKPLPSEKFYAVLSR